MRVLLLIAVFAFAVPGCARAEKKGERDSKPTIEDGQNHEQAKKPDAGPSEEAKAAYERGFALAQKGEFQQAIADFSEAVRLSPDFTFAYNQRGMAWSELGDSDKAISDFDSAIRTASQPSYFLYMNRGNEWRVKKQFEKAYADLDKAVELAANAPPKLRARVLEARGLIFFEKKDFEKGVADLNETIRLDPKLASAYRHRSNYWTLNKDHDKSIADLTDAIKLQPLAATYSFRANHWAQKKEYEKAFADFAEAIRLNPKDYTSMRVLAKLLASVPDAKLRDGPRAIALAKKAYDLDKESFQSLEILAAAHAEAGDFKEAVSWQEKAVAHPRADPIGARVRLKLYQDKRPFRSE